MRTRSPARITIVDDHELFAEAMEISLTMSGHDVRRILLHQPSRSQEALIGATIRTRPDIVLLDLDLRAHGSGMRMIAPLTLAGVAVVVVTGNGDRVSWGEALRHGARCVLEKEASLNAVVATVRRITEGLAVISRTERDALIRLWHEHHSEARLIRNRLESLTRREAAVLGHLIEGRQVRDIARAEVLSEATIRTQVKSILAKLEVNSQLSAVGAAHRAEWRPPTSTSTRGLP